MTLFSPGVEIKEKDFSLIVPTVANGIGGMVGRFTSGPIEKPTLISSEDQLKKVFGPPNDINANEWFCIAEFLRYTNKCWVVRAAPTGYSNAVASGISTTQIPTLDAYETTTQQTFTDSGAFIAKNPGLVGNGIGVFVVDSANWNDFVAYDAANVAIIPKPLTSYFSSAPSTSDYVAQRTVDATAKLDEVHILVVDVTGKFTGTPMTVLESYSGLSKASDATDYKGTSIYYATVINTSSKYLWWSAHPTHTVTENDIAWGSTALEVGGANKTFAAITTTYYNVTLSGGLDGTSPDLASIKFAYDTLSNKELYDVNLIMAGAFNLGTPGEIEKYVIELAATRKDCVAFVSPHALGLPIKDGTSTVTDVIAFKANIGVSDQDATYGFMDTGMKYIYDRYNKKYRWVPLNGDTAGISARVDSIAEAWFSPGGFNRGGVKNAIKFAYNPKQADRDILYPKSINAVIFDPASGPVLFGDKTMTSKPSAFDRINVRRLFIILEKAISIATKWQLFEFNDAFTRAQFKNMVEPFLRNIQGRRGITDFLVVCSEDNNTGEVIDRNEFVADIFIKPNRSINFITLNFVATRTDVSFNTIIGG